MKKLLVLLTMLYILLFAEAQKAETIGITSQSLFPDYLPVGYIPKIGQSCCN